MTKTTTGLSIPPVGETILLELRQVELLIAVAVIDVTHDGLSSVYTFFDPAEDRRSLGVYAILKSIELTREQRCPGCTWATGSMVAVRCSTKRNIFPSTATPTDDGIRGRRGNLERLRIAYR